MDLTVKFTGLCMFVRDPSRTCTHVLMPDSPAGPHFHELSLEYNGLRGKLDLRHRVLDLSGAGGTGMGVDVPTAVLDAGAPADLEVDAQQWSARPRSTVVSRVTLPPFNRVDPGLRAKWNVRIKREADGTTLSAADRRLVHEITWTVNDVSSAFFDTWTLDPLPADRARPSLQLPRPTGTTARLEIRHAPASQPPTHRDDEAPHFGMFYPIFETRPEKRPHPYLGEEPPEKGGSPFNCILAQSPPG